MHNKNNEALRLPTCYAPDSLTRSSRSFLQPFMASCSKLIPWFVLILVVSAGNGCGSGIVSDLSHPKTSSSISSVQVQCDTTTVQPGKSTQCTAAVSGTGDYDQSVKWTSNGGTMSTSGLYTAPNVGAATTTSVTATSTQDSSKAASISVLVVPNTITAVTVTCTSTSLQPGQSAQCTANVQGTGTFSSAVTWSASSGPISGSGVFTAPSVTTSTQVKITATTVQQGIAANFTLTVTPPSTVGSVATSCIPQTIQSGQTSQCTATVRGTGTFNPAVTWSATIGTASTSGVYTAPLVSAATQVQVTAQSVQDPSQASSAPLTVNPISTTPDISELMRRQAIISYLRGVIEDDPEFMLPQIALMNAVATNSSAFPATALTATLAKFRKQMASWEATNSSESELAGHRHGFELLRQLSVQGVPSTVYASTVLRADVSVLATVDAPSVQMTSDLAWAQQRNALIYDLLSSVLLNCASQASYCDSILADVAKNVPTLGSSTATVCASARAAVVPCQFLQQATAAMTNRSGSVIAHGAPSTTITAETLQNAVGAAVVNIAADIKACIDQAAAGQSGSGQSTCKTKSDNGGKDQSLALANIGNAASSVGSTLGLLTSQQANEVKTLGSVANTLYNDAVNINTAFGDKTFTLTALQNADWGKVVSVLFSSGASGLKADPTLSAVSTLISIASMSTDMASAVTTLIKVFGGASSNNDNAQVLSAIASLKSMIKAFQDDMHVQFAIVDIRLANLTVAMANGFTLVDDKLNNQNITLLQIQTAISDLNSQISWLATSASADAQAIERANLNLTVIGLQTPITQEEFAKELAVLTQYITTVSGDATFAGANYTYTPLGIYTTLSQHQSDYNFAYLAGLGQAVLKSRSYGSNLANSTEVLYAGNLYLQLLQMYPSFASSQGATITKQISFIMPVITALNQATLLIQSDTSLFPNLLAAYSDALTSLQTTVSNSTQKYLTGVATSNQSPSYVNLFAGPDQPGISYVPQAVQTGLVPPCGSAPGENLQMPANWKNLIPTGVLAAEAVGVGTIHVCYSLPTDAGSYGWAKLYEFKIKVGEYQAFADLQVTINVLLNTTLVRSYEVDYPAGLPYGQSGICFFSNTGGIQVAPSQVPAWTALAAAWTGTFRGQGTYCNGYVLTNLKSIFESSAFNTYDWTTSSPADYANNTAAVSAALLKLQAGWNQYVSNQLGTSGSELASAAQSATGYRLALTQYLELAYGNLLATNTTLQNLLNGSNALPTVATLQNLYTSAGAQTQLATTPTNFTSSVSSSTQALLNVIKANNPQGYINFDLEALTTKLSLFVESIGNIQ